MKQQITVGAAQKLTSPNPFALLTVRKPDGTPNAMAVSWWTYTSNHPASLAVCLSKKGYSGQCILNEGRFALNIVGEELSDAAFGCGTCSGRSMDKIAKFGIPLEEEDGLSYVCGNRVTFFCRLTQSVALEDHVLYLAEIEKIYGDEDVRGLYAWNGYGALRSV